MQLRAANRKLTGTPAICFEIHRCGYDDSLGARGKALQYRTSKTYLAPEAVLGDGKRGDGLGLGILPTHDVRLRHSSLLRAAGALSEHDLALFVEMRHFRLHQTFSQKLILQPAAVTWSKRQTRRQGREKGVVLPEENK